MRLLWAVSVAHTREVWVAAVFIDVIRGYIQYHSFIQKMTENCKFRDLAKFCMEMMIYRHVECEILRNARDHNQVDTLLISVFVAGVRNARS